MSSDLELGAFDCKIIVLTTELRDRGFSFLLRIAQIVNKNPVCHCEEPRGSGTTKQSQDSSEIATPFGLAMTTFNESRCNLFYAPSNKSPN
jgi:hypothetical protein